MRYILSDAAEASDDSDEVDDMFGAESLEDFIHKSVAKKSLARISEAPSEEEDMMSSIIESFRRKIQSVENVDIK